MNFSKGISTPIAILLIVVVSAVVGVLVWQFTKPSPEVEIHPPEWERQSTQSACEEAGYYWYDEACHEEEQSETADWETYTNEEYGFKFKYPENWRGISTSSERMGTNFLFLLTRDRRKPVEDSLQFSLSIYEDRNMVQSEALKKEPIETERKDIASESTEIFTYSGDFQGPHDVTFKMSGQYTWLEKDNLHFLLDGAVAGNMDGWSEKKEVFSKILSTFKFTK